MRHNPWAGNVLAFNVPQLNKTHTYESAADNQLRSFAHVGITDRDLSAGEQVPVLADPYDPAADLTSRARSYLHTNCAHCHRIHAGSSVLSKMRYDLELDKTTMINERPSQGTFGLVSARVIAPGEPYRSMLWYRMSKLGRGRMPHIGSTVVDQEGVNLIHDWISMLPPVESSVETGPVVAVDPSAADLQKILESESFSPQRRSAEIDRLLASTGGAMRALRLVEQTDVDQQLRQLIIDRGVKHADSPVRDLFERFVPEEQRVKRLGSIIQPEQILSLTGDTVRGRDLFVSAAGVTCRNCHRLGETGKQLGPDLRESAGKNSPEQLLESLLNPSKKIDPKFATYLVETKRGRVHTGLLVKKTDDEIVLKDATNKEIRVARADVELMEQQKQSLMPELLLRDMTAQEVADLLAFLKSLPQKAGSQKSE